MRRQGSEILWMRLIGIYMEDTLRQREDERVNEPLYLSTQRKKIEGRE